MSCLRSASEMALNFQHADWMSGVYASGRCIIFLLFVICSICIVLPLKSINFVAFLIALFDTLFSYYFFYQDPVNAFVHSEKTASTHYCGPYGWRPWICDFDGKAFSLSIRDDSVLLKFKCNLEEIFTATVETISIPSYNYVILGTVKFTLTNIPNAATGESTTYEGPVDIFTIYPRIERPNRARLFVTEKITEPTRHATIAKFESYNNEVLDFVTICEKAARNKNLNIEALLGDPTDREAAQSKASETLYDALINLPTSESGK